MFLKSPQCPTVLFHEAIHSQFYLNYFKLGISYLQMRALTNTGTKRHIQQKYCTTTSENSLAVSTKADSIHTLRSNNTIPRCISNVHAKYMCSNIPDSRMFIKTLFIISKTQKQHKYPSKVEWINYSIPIVMVNFMCQLDWAKGYPD